MDEIQILICGHGNMAAELERVCLLQPNVKPIRFESRALRNPLAGNIVAVHFGGGSQLLKLIEFCDAHAGGAPIIQGSTSGPNMPKLPENPPVTIINAPNLALPIIKLFGLLSQLREIFDSSKMKISVKESHQESKKTVPGTAVKFAEGLGIPKEEIISVRDPAVQLKQLGVLPQFLGGHGYHFIVADGGGVEIDLSTKINGREAYALGDIELAWAVSDPFWTRNPGYYDAIQVATRKK